MNIQDEWERVENLPISDNDIILFLARKGYIGGADLKRLATLEAKKAAALLKITTAEELKVQALKSRENIAAAKDAAVAAEFNLHLTEQSLKAWLKPATLEEVAEYIGMHPVTVRSYGDNKKRALIMGVTEIKRLKQC